VQELERQMAIGRSFIRPEERPDVGRAVLEDEETDGATEDARGDD
jgi:hypothetical protein